MKTCNLIGIGLVFSCLFTFTPARSQSSTISNICLTDKGEKRFFVLNEVEGSGIGVCEATASAGPASLSFSRDYVGNTDAGFADVSLAFRLGKIGTNKKSAFSTLAYLSMDGNFNSDSSTNILRIGSYSELYTKTGSRAPQRQSDLNLLFGASIFYQTDLDFHAEGYGANIIVTPVLNSDRFGVNYFSTKGGPHLIARAKLEALSIDKGGDTGYSDDTELLNLSTTLGFGYATAKGAAFPLSTRIDYTQGYNLLNGDSFDILSASVTVPLGKSENVSLSLRYDREEVPNNQLLAETSGLTLNFSF